MRPNRIPEPALVRSVLIALTGVAAYLLGRQVDTSWIESVLTLYGLLTPIIAGVLIRPAVTPVARHTPADAFEYSVNVGGDTVTSLQALERWQRRQREGRHRAED